MAKVEPTLNYGGDAVLVGDGFEEALAEALRRAEETGATFVHAFEDERVIAGQGTIGLELAEQVPGRSAPCSIPIGGGGLASGIAIALARSAPRRAARRRRGAAATATRSPTGSRSRSPAS